MSGSRGGLRERLDAGLDGTKLQRRHGERQEKAGREDEGDHGPAQDRSDDLPPDSTLAVIASEPVDEGNSAPLDAVAEPGERGREDRERSQHGHRDQDRAQGKSGHALYPGEEHAGHGDDDGQPGDEHRAAEVAAAARAPPRRPAARSSRSRFK